MTMHSTVSIFCDTCDERKIADVPAESAPLFTAPCHDAEVQRDRTIHSTFEDGQ